MGSDRVDVPSVTRGQQPLLGFRLSALHLPSRREDDRDLPQVARDDSRA